MRRRRILALAIALVAAVVVAGVLGALLGRVSGGNDLAAGVGRDGIEVRGTLVPRSVLFGDTVRAVVDVVVDRRVVDPETVRVRAQFLPWQIAGIPERVREDAGDTTLLRTTYVLRCLTSPCVPSGQIASLQFDDGRVVLTRREDGEVERRALPVEWPLLSVYSRYWATRADPDAEGIPWQADLVSMPNASFRIAPGLLLVIIVVGSALAAAAGLALAYVAWPRRVPAPPPEPEPEPLPSLTPLEQALALLEESAADGASDQRRALELVAEELEEWGDVELAGAARTLAWSAGVPRVDETAALASRVRAELERELLERELLAEAAAGGNGDGRVA